MTDYRDTLNLPQTDFPMRAGLPENEPKWVERWKEEDLFNAQRKAREGAPKFILHNGPPYANGHLHMGHALNMSLKDIINRSKFMAGFDTPFVPGWDCHGLPIEWKVETDLRKEGKDKNDLSRKELRALCRAEAAKWIEIQTRGWQRLGAMGDFACPYRTMDFQNEADTVRELGKMAAKGYLYKGNRSVMWSTVEETALAEAEVEYKDKESTAVYVAYPVAGRENEYVVIWTTTPWTLPASKAVAYHESTEYVAIRPMQLHAKATADKDAVYWVARDLLESFTKMTGIEEYSETATQKGKAFADVQVIHPFYGDTLPMVPGHHVTTEAGTGFVHTAPAHGADDFQIGVRFKLDTTCPVNGSGHYEADVRPLEKTGKPLAGQDIWSSQDLIIDELVARGRLLRWYKMTHSYPVSWRSKAPLIFRTTPQWFVNLDDDVDGSGSIRRKALDAIHGENGVEKVRWVPAYGESRIGSMIANRFDWCLSRQRAWGTPIAIFKNLKTNEYIFDEAVFESVAKKMEEQGIDAWDELPVAELLPEGWLEKNGLNIDDLQKETDILDVWFDSGTTHAHVLDRRPELTWPADLYLEGSDQHRGWFHSSLLTGVATRNAAPYRQVLTHGFVVDGEGKKMSKSLGNGIALEDLLKNYGMDIARLWVAGADYSEDIRLSEEILKNSAEAYRRFRNTFRFLLGNLADFDAERDAVAIENMPGLERFMLHKLKTVLESVAEDYENYRFHGVFHTLHNFCSVELSGQYFDIRKDALYCDAPDSARRRACQTVLETLLKALTTWLAPIMPFTTDEVWRSRYGQEKGVSVHLQTFLKPEKAWEMPVKDAQAWESIFLIRHHVNMAREEQRTAGVIKHDYEADVALTLNAAELGSGEAELAPLYEDMKDVFLVSGLNLIWGSGDAVSATVKKHTGEKCPRCWTYHESLSEKGVCTRCSEAVAAREAAA